MVKELPRRLTIHCAWWIRNENLDSAVSQVNRTFHSLAELHPTWRSWYLLPKSIQFEDEPDRAIFDNTDLIRQKFLSSQKSYDGGPFNYDLGYSIMVLSEPVNGKGVERSNLWMSCCHRTKYAGYNILSIQLPTKEHAPDLYSVDLLCRTVNILVEVWDPDSLVAWDLRTKLTPEPWVPGPVLGWVNYFPRRTAIVDEELPPGWRWFEARGDKQIFIHEGGWPDASNAQHAAAFKQMFECIHWSEPPEGVTRVP